MMIMFAHMSMYEKVFFVHLLFGTHNAIDLITKKSTTPFQVTATE